MVRGWGRGEESWLLHWGEIFGDPIEENTWSELDDLMAQSFPHPSGAELRVQCFAVDSGHRTQAVYDYVRKRSPRAMAVKGSSMAASPVIAGRPSWQDVSWQGQKIERGVQLWQIGVGTAKSELYARLKIAEPGARCMHFPRGLPDEYYGHDREFRRAEEVVVLGPLLDRQPLGRVPLVLPELAELQVHEGAEALAALSLLEEVRDELGEAEDRLDQVVQFGDFQATSSYFSVEKRPEFRGSHWVRLPSISAIFCTDFPRPPIWCGGSFALRRLARSHTAWRRA